MKQLGRWLMVLMVGIMVWGCADSPTTQKEQGWEFVGNRNPGSLMTGGGCSELPDSGHVRKALVMVPNPQGGILKFDCSELSADSTVKLIDLFMRTGSFTSLSTSGGGDDTEIMAWWGVQSVGTNAPELAEGYSYAWGDRGEVDVGFVSEIPYYGEYEEYMGYSTGEGYHVYYKYWNTAGSGSGNGPGGGNNPPNDPPPSPPPCPPTSGDTDDATQLLDFDSLSLPDDTGVEICNGSGAALCMSGNPGVWVGAHNLPKPLSHFVHTAVATTEGSSFQVTELIGWDKFPPSSNRLRDSIAVRSSTPYYAGFDGYKWIKVAPTSAIPAVNTAIDFATDQYTGGVYTGSSNRFVSTVLKRSSIGLSAEQLHSLGSAPGIDACNIVNN